MLAPNPSMMPMMGQQAPQLPQAQPQAPAAPLPPQPAPKWHDVTIRTKTVTERARIEAVPPEEFGISRFARSLSFEKCGYCFHEVLKREEDLISEGYDVKQIKAIPTFNMLSNAEQLARDTVDEHLAAGGDQGINEANRQIKLTEHYIRMDYEGNGKVFLYRVETGGDQGEVLLKDGEPQIIKEDFVPFAAMTPVIMPHRFFGRSIADLVMDIQRIKTSLTRAVLDNAYVAVNPRCEVAESHSTETTIDDLLVSRPNQIVRTKIPGGLQWQTTPLIAGEVFPIIEYADSTREWRTGVTRQSQGIDANALQNQSATAVNQVFNAAQAKVKLIARIFAETGIRDLFQLLHATIRKHGTKAQMVKLGNEWVKVDPRDWVQRKDMTVSVGLGTGDKNEQLQRMMVLYNMQKDAIAAGKTNLVTDANLYATSQIIAKLVGHKDGEEFFSNPKTQPPPQTAPDPKLMQIQAQAQLQQAKQQTDQAHQMAKLQADMALAQQKFQLEMKAMMAETAMKGEQHQQQLQHDYEKHVMTLQQKMHDQQIKQSQASQPKASIEVKHGADQITGPISQAVAQLGDHLAKHTQAQTQAITAALQHALGPKRVVRGKDGKVSHVEPMAH